MLKRVSSHLKSLKTGFLSEINGAVSAITGLNQAASEQQGKVAAELLQKSPFEIDDSPQEKMKRNPLAFSSVNYPLDLGSDELGHYILFYTLQNSYASGKNKNMDFDVAAKVGLTSFDDDDNESYVDFRKTQGGNNVDAVKVDNSVLSAIPSHQRVTSAIALYMPPNTKVTYTNSYEQEAAELSGALAKTIAGAATAGSNQEAIKGAIANASGEAAMALAQFGKNALGEAASLLGAGDPVKLASKAFGVAVNPYNEQFYEGPQFRQFSYNFEFWPRSKAELTAVQNIIFLFKYHSAPGVNRKGMSGRLFEVPSEFEIHYLYKGKENEYMNKISKCALETVDVSYGPEAQSSFFEGDEKGAAPVTYKLGLTFKELELITKDKIYNGM